MLTKLACTGLEPLPTPGTFDTLEVNSAQHGWCNRVPTLRTGNVECGIHFGKVDFLLLGHSGVNYTHGLTSNPRG